jgi:hypothetical protein
MSGVKMLHLPPFKPNEKDTTVRDIECSCRPPSKSGRKYLGWDSCNKCGKLIRA